MHMCKDYALTAGSEVRSLSVSPSSATYWLWVLDKLLFFLALPFPICLMGVTEVPISKSEN